jgi:cis-3-alkyl-4-acyloxetan-2-one decarboxylase
LRIDGIDVIVEGRGTRSILMIHGWPDTHRLWEGQVAALSERYRCVRFTLPGFERAAGKRAYSLDEVIELIRRIVEQACAGERVVLMVHDWGCLFGYQFATRHPHLVERVIGVDIGDAGSRRNLAELGVKGKLLVLAYQLWLATAWRIGGATGDLMARAMARALRCPTDPRSIHSGMGYPYALRWFGVAGGLKNLKSFEPRAPMLFVYGEHKPFMFHSRAWAERLAARSQSRVVGLPTGHWVMIGRERDFNHAVSEWLGDSQL